MSVFLIEIDTWANGTTIMRRDDAQRPESVPRPQFRKTALVVGDDEVYRDAVSRAATFAGYHVKVACCGKSAMQYSRERPVHFAILDFNLSDMDGISLFRKLRKKHPVLNGMIYTRSDTQTIAGDAGIVAVLSKDFEESNLRAFIFSEYSADIPTESLTPRQFEVLKLLAYDLSQKVIANQLSISPKSVEAHSYHIRNKLGIHGRVGLCRYAIRQGLIEP